MCVCKYGPIDSNFSLIIFLFVAKGIHCLSNMDPGMQGCEDEVCLKQSKLKHRDLEVKNLQLFLKAIGGDWWSLTPSLEIKGCVPECPFVMTVTFLISPFVFYFVLEGSSQCKDVTNIQHACCCRDKDE